MSGELQAPEGFKFIIALLRHIFPDLEITVEDEMYEGERGIIRWKATGTYTGELPGYAPTGGRATWTGITINRFADGKVAETWLYIDSTPAR